MQSGTRIVTSNPMAMRLLLTTLILTCLSSCKAQEKESYRRLCVNSAANMCLVPYQALFVSRDSWVGKTVSLSGYLRGDGQRFALYQTEELGSYGVQEGAVLLQGGEFSRQLDDLNKSRVIVSGVVMPSKEYWLDLQLESPPVEAPRAIDEFEEAPPRPREEPGSKH